MIQYKEIDGFPSYLVGDDGVVYSMLERVFRTKTQSPGWRIGESKRPLSTVLNKRGYLCVRLCKNSKIHHKRVHTIVLNAFRGPRPKGMECRHLDGNKTNNRLDNLKWGTHLENCNDRAIHGTDRCGEDHGCAKLTVKTIEMIRRDRINGALFKELSGRYKISISHAHRIVNGDSWSCIPINEVAA